MTATPEPTSTETRRLRAEHKAAERSKLAADRELLRPHVAEWFGHRVFPTVADHPAAQADQISQRCPFLSEVASEPKLCVKNPNSRGVCTISAGSNKTRQDWLVCPHRALDDDLLHPMIRRLYAIQDGTPVNVVPVNELADKSTAERLVSAVHTAGAPQQFLTFQQYFGGEIALPRTPGSPELSFDATIVEVVPSDGDGGIALGRYGVIEMQTTDTHGSYRQAVEALTSALDLHPKDFARQVANHPDWPGRKVEGPNISNVFKRTFYQVMFKFQITRRTNSVGAILALPRPVWQSWLPFLGAPALVDMGDGIYQLMAADDPAAPAALDNPSWIYVFDVVDTPPPDGRPTPVHVDSIIATDAPTLSRLALEVAPGNAVGDGQGADSVSAALQRRVSVYLPLT